MGIVISAAKGRRPEIIAINKNAKRHPGPVRICNCARDKRMVTIGFDHRFCKSAWLVPKDHAPSCRNVRREIITDK